MRLAFEELPKYDYRGPALPFRGQLPDQADRGTHRNFYRGDTYHIAGRGITIDSDGGKRYFAQDTGRCQL